MRSILSLAVFVFAFSLPATSASAQQNSRTPEECIVVKGKSAATATYNGKTYAFRYAECREEFLADPERYAQLYDALIELEASGVKLEPAPPSDSLVPS